MAVSLIVIDSDGSRRLRAVNDIRCFARKFTELSDSELPNSTVTGVTHRSLMNLISAAWAIWCSYMEERSLVESVGILLNLSFWMAERVSSVSFELEGRVMIDVKVVRYCTYVEFWERSISVLKKLKFTYEGCEISTKCTFGSATFCVVNQIRSHQLHTKS